MQVALVDFQEAFGLGDEGHIVVVKLTDLDLADAVKGKLDLGDELMVRTWSELLPELQQMVDMKKAGQMVFFLLLGIMVTFSTFNTFAMTVFERTREFGVMMALGVKPARLGSLVITETIVMSGLGLAIGAVLGIALTWYLSIVGFSYPGMAEMAERFNLPDRMYPSLSLLSIMLGPSIVFLFSLLASIYPAIRLFFLQPVAAMRAV